MSFEFQGVEMPDKSWTPCFGSLAMRGKGGPLLRHAKPRYCGPRGQGPQRIVIPARTCMPVGTVLSCYTSPCGARKEPLSTKSCRDLDFIHHFLPNCPFVIMEAIKGTVNDMLGKLNLSSFNDKSGPVQVPSEEDLKSLQDKYKKAHQEHVFAFYDELSDEEKAALFAQLSDFDPERINVLADKALNPPKTQDNSEEVEIQPLPEKATASTLDSKQEDLDKWYKIGLEQVAENKVAVVLMAGGQGTRLGSSDPKGCFDIGLPSKKSLFQLQAERILKIQKLAEKQSGKEEATVPWYVMTSGPTRKPTEKFFQDHDYFGMKSENVIIFEQGVLPCISNEGKILLESKSRVAVAPNGNGGIYHALLMSEARTDMRKRGIEHLHAYCVDNCLVRVADPTFIGFAASKEVDIATKVVRKRSAGEPVGLILQKNGRPDVIEYSEIDKDMAAAKESPNSDKLKFRAANIVNHYYSFEFIESIQEWEQKLPHHVARKKIPYIDTEKGETIKPEKPNGIKLEQFVFDVFPFLELKQFACLEVDRKDEFSPLKNAKGDDSPETSRQDILQQGTRWVKAVGATVTSEQSDADGVEVSPLISYVSTPIAHVCKVLTLSSGRRRSRVPQGQGDQGPSSHRSQQVNVIGLPSDIQTLSSLHQLLDLLLESIIRSNASTSISCSVKI